MADNNSKQPPVNVSIDTKGIQAGIDKSNASLADMQKEVPGIKDALNNLGKANSGKKGEKPKSTTGDKSSGKLAAALSEISAEIKSIHDFLQERMKKEDAPANKKSAPTEATPGKGTDNLSEALMSSFGSAKFRTYFKDALTPTLVEFLKNSEAQESIKKILLETAQENAKNEKPAETGYGVANTEKASVPPETPKEEKKSVSETSEIFAGMKDSLDSVNQGLSIENSDNIKNNEAQIQAMDSVKDAIQSVGDKNINSLNTKSSDSNLNGINESLKEFSSSFTDLTKDSSNNTDKIDASISNLANDMSKVDNGDQESANAAAMDNISQTIMAGGENIKECMALSVDLIRSELSKNADKNGSSEQEILERLNNLAKSYGADKLLGEPMANLMDELVAEGGETPVPSPDSAPAEGKKEETVKLAVEQLSESLIESKEEAPKEEKPKNDKGEENISSLNKNVERFSSIADKFPTSKEITSIMQKPKDENAVGVKQNNPLLLNNDKKSDSASDKKSLKSKVVGVGTNVTAKLGEKTGKGMQTTGKSISGAGAFLASKAKSIGFTIKYGMEGIGTGIKSLSSSLKDSTSSSKYLAPVGSILGGMGNAVGQGIRMSAPVLGFASEKASKITGNAMNNVGDKITSMGKTIEKNSIKLAQPKQPPIIQPNKTGGNEGIITILTGILNTLKKGNEIRQKEFAENKAKSLRLLQFGNGKKGDDKKPSKMDFSSIAKTLKKSFASLPDALVKSLMKAKAKTIIMIISLIVGLGLLIWAMIKNPALRKKIGNLISGFFKWLWSTIQSWCKKASLKAIIIVGILLALVAMWALPIGLIGGLIVFAIVVIGALVIKYWNKIKAFWNSWYPLILGFLVGLALFHVLGPWGILVGAVVMLFALIWKFKDKIWKAIKKLARFIWKVIKWPFSWLAKLFPGLGKKLKNAIFSLLSKIPFIGKFFKPDAEDTADEAKEKAEAAKEDEEESDTWDDEDDDEEDDEEDEDEDEEDEEEEEKKDEGSGFMGNMLGGMGGGSPSSGVSSPSPVPSSSSSSNVDATTNNNYNKSVQSTPGKIIINITVKLDEKSLNLNSHKIDLKSPIPVKVMQDEMVKSNMMSRVKPALPPPPSSASNKNDKSSDASLQSLNPKANKNDDWIIWPENKQNIEGEKPENEQNGQYDDWFFWPENKQNIEGEKPENEQNGQNAEGEKSKPIDVNIVSNSAEKPGLFGSIIGGIKNVAGSVAKNGVFATAKSLIPNSIKDKFKGFGEKSFFEKIKTVGSVGVSVSKGIFSKVSSLIPSSIKDKVNDFRQKSFLEKVKTVGTLGFKAPSFILSKIKEKLNDKNESSNIKESVKTVEVKGVENTKNNQNIISKDKKLSNIKSDIKTNNKESNIKSIDKINSNDKESLKTEKSSKQIESDSSQNREKLKTVVKSKVNDATKLTDKQKSITNSIAEVKSKGNNQIPESGGNIQEIVKALPNAIKIGIASYFDNKELKVKSKKIDSLSMTKSDVSDKL